jgi:hypothetical protein
MLRTAFIKAKTSSRPRKVSIPHYSPEPVVVGVEVGTNSRGKVVVDLTVHRDGSYEVAENGKLVSFGRLT